MIDGKDLSKLKNVMIPCLNQKIELFQNVATTHATIIIYPILFDAIFVTLLYRCLHCLVIINKHIKLLLVINSKINKSDDTTSEW